jgi:asparagine synthase (glutamine-hydrolysing)
VRALVTREYLEHPWMALAPKLPAGKRYHLSAIASHGALFYPFTFNRERVATSVSVLTSQPVLELALRLPTYTLLLGGVSRGLARRAFADLLPTQVKNRTIKGTSVTFLHHLMRQNMGLVRETLIDGVLVRDNFLDRAKTAAYLTEGQTFQTVDLMQVMAYLSAEVWLRQSASIQQRAAA